MFDDEYGIRLLAPLKTGPAGPARIDVARAMRDGLRMRRRRWWSAGLISTLAAGLLTGGLLLAPAQDDKPPVLPPEPALPTSCTVAVLPTGDFTSAEVEGGDSTGRWLFGQSNPVADTGAHHLLVWHDGKLVADTELPGITLAMEDINSSGVIVGLGRDPKNGLIQGYYYRDGRFGVLKGGAAEAAAINDDGVIVGRLGTVSTSAVRWRSPDAEAEKLPLPAGTNVKSDATAIAPDGTIAGVVYSAEAKAATNGPLASRGYTGYLWLPDGTVRMLDLPPGPDEAWATGSPVDFRYGWLYANRISVPRTPGVLGTVQAFYRYDPVSGVWQRVADNDYAAQLPASSRRGGHEFLTPVPKVYVGSRILTLPLGAPIADPDVDNALVAASSDDTHVLAGFVVAGHEDATQPFRPLIWRCR